MLKKIFGGILTVSLNGSSISRRTLVKGLLYEGGSILEGGIHLKKRGLSS